LLDTSRIGVPTDIERISDGCALRYKRSQPSDRLRRQVAQVSRVRKGTGSQLSRAGAIANDRQALAVRSSIAQTCHRIKPVANFVDTQQTGSTESSVTDGVVIDFLHFGCACGRWLGFEYDNRLEACGPTSCRHEPPAIG